MSRHLCGKLKAFATAHGCKLAKVSPATFRRLNGIGLSVAPFTTDLGIQWSHKELYYVRYDQWAEIIHELGHLLATTATPMKAKEYEFFGWELALVKYIGGSFDHWLETNNEYSVNEGDDLGRLNPVELYKLLAERLEVAQTAGLLINGIPQAIR